MRFGPKQLEESVQRYNEAMAADGVLKRFVVGGRNGYQAADEYTVDADGNRIGSGVDRNVGCGTSREVDRYCEIRHYQLRNAVGE
jgi:hypothetical protein